VRKAEEGEEEGEGRLEGGEEEVMLVLAREKEEAEEGQ